MIRVVNKTILGIMICFVSMKYSNFAPSINCTIHATMKKFILPLLLVTCLILLSGRNEREFTIYMIGDSTMANKKLDGGNPERGWGFVLPGFFSEK